MIVRETANSMVIGSMSVSPIETLGKKSTLSRRRGRQSARAVSAEKQK